RSDSTIIASGTLETVDNQVDTTTGTVKLRAIFPNDDESLFPSQFVNAHLLVDTLHDATLIPVAAVQQGAPGSSVYAVSPNNTVCVRIVKLGPTDGQNYVVTSGVSLGDKVVVDGVDRLRDGAKITIPTSKPDTTNPNLRQNHPGAHRHRPQSSSSPSASPGGSASPG